MPGTHLPSGSSPPCKLALKVAPTAYGNPASRQRGPCCEERTVADKRQPIVPALAPERSLVVPGELHTSLVLDVLQQLTCIIVTSHSLDGRCPSRDRSRQHTVRSPPLFTPSTTSISRLAIIRVPASPIARILSTRAAPSRCITVAALTGSSPASCQAVRRCFANRNRHIKRRHSRVDGLCCKYCRL